MIFHKEYKILEQIAEEPKTKKKLLILEKNREVLRDVVFYALDFTKKYNIKKFPLPDSKLKRNGDRHSVFDYLDGLSKVRGAKLTDSHNLAEMCQGEEDIEVIRRILNKDLRCGISLKSAQKVYPDLPNKDIMLCYKAARVIIRKGKKKVSPELMEFVNECGGWKNVGISEKENGVRDKISIVNGKVVHISRNGLAYNNFGIFNEAILILAESVKSVIKTKKPVIFDGEVVSVDEDFEKQMTQIRRLENVDPSIFELRLFDIPSLSLTQEEREDVLREAYENIPKKFKIKMKLSLCTKVKDKEAFFVVYDEITNKRKKEGVVLKNLKGTYENKRSAFWCKVKTFFSEDLVVLRAVKGKAGKKFAGTLGALYVDYKGVEVKVGSGYTPEERDKFIKKQPKVIEVEYKEVTKAGSLFHGTFVRVREDK